MGLERDSEYSDLTIDGDDFCGADLTGSTFVRCLFRRVRLAGGLLAGTIFDRCEFNGTDLSNADLSESTVEYSTVVDSKLLGTVFAGADIRTVQVQDSLCKMLSCFRASVREVTFLGCDLDDSDWREARIVNSALVRCELSGAQFVSSRVRDLDIRGSTLDGSLSLAEARGFVVGSDQVLALAARTLSEVGTRLDDDEIPGLADLPGGRDVLRLRPIDAEAGLRGIREARARSRSRS